MASIHDIGVPGQPLNTPPLTQWQAAVRDALGGSDSAMKDTGWRVISSQLLNSFAGTVYIRRLGQRVTVGIYGVSRATAVPGVAVPVLANAPAGFAMDSHVAGYMLNQTDLLDPTVPTVRTGSFLQVTNVAGSWVAIASWPANSKLHTVIEYVTADAWPTTLPGIPG